MSTTIHLSSTEAHRKMRNILKNILAHCFSSALCSELMVHGFVCVTGDSTRGSSALTQ